MADATDFEAYRRADIRFHIGVAEAARSPRLVEAMTGVQGEMSGLIAADRLPGAGVDPFQRAARATGPAARGRRPARARSRTMRDHIEGTEHILAGLLPRPLDG